MTCARSSLKRHGGLVTGVRAREVETGEEFEFDARVVINAAGIFSDEIRQLDDPAEAPMTALSQGTHLVLGRIFLPGESAILVPKTADGRVLFAVPWHGRVIVGATGAEVGTATLEPRARADEVDFLLRHAAIYLARDPRREDVLSIYSGIRPLVRASGDKGAAALARNHVLTISRSNLVTITGGKWTTYRKMGRTRWTPPSWWRGRDVSLHPRLPYFLGEVAWAARRQMARTVEDVLARRTPALLLDARASAEAAPAVADILAGVLGRDAAWQATQIAAYRALAEGYVLT
ncbi:hypothetical protein CNY89_03270 [Amaricoccus sp. HAR-UPW-R2A-40]|nr:hypothetical protein CNY89_03270 [Amaricoccus sp. HAR-UPW-R2A-40]